MTGGGCMARGLCAIHAPWPDTMRYGQSMNGRYASYWNAFLLLMISISNLKQGLSQTVEFSLEMRNFI